MRRAIACAAAVAALVGPGTASAGFVNEVDFVGTSGFDPEVQSQRAGGAVRWDNPTGSTHTATSYEGVFDTGNVGDGEVTAPFDFVDPGRLEYFCRIHPGMRGVLAIHADVGGGGARPQLDARPGYGNLTSAAYAVGGAATTISPGLTLADADSAQLASAFAAIRAGFEQGDVLEFTPGNGITGDFDANSGLLTLTGASSVANYEAALRSVRFRTSAATGPRRISFGAQDDTGTQAPPDFREVVVSAPAPADPGGGGGGGGGGAATPPAAGPQQEQPPAILPPPVARPLGPLVLRLRRTAFTVDRGGRVTLAFTTDPGLRGAVDLAPAGRGTPLGRASFRANARGAVSVRVRLSQRARRALKRARTRRLRARIVVSSGARTASRAVTLRRRR